MDPAKVLSRKDGAYNYNRPNINPAQLKFECLLAIQLHCRRHGPPRRRLPPMQRQAELRLAVAILYSEDKVYLLTASCLVMDPALLRWVYFVTYI